MEIPKKKKRNREKLFPNVVAFRVTNEMLRDIELRSKKHKDMGSFLRSHFQKRFITAADCFKSLPKDLQEAIYLNIRPDTPVSGCDLPVNVLAWLFSWKDSVQGYDFWEKVYNQYKGLENERVQ